MILGMEQYGLYLYLFPFLLTLALVYGVLSYSMKEQLPNSARAVVSLVAAFFVLMFSFLNPGIVSFFVNLFGFGLIIGSGVLILVFLLGMFGIKPENVTGEKKAKWLYVAIVSVSTVVVITASLGTMLLGGGVFLQSTQVWVIVFFAVIVVGAMYLLGSGK
jgi:hypothetical protein